MYYEKYKINIEVVCITYQCILYCTLYLIIKQEKLTEVVHFVTATAGITSVRSCNFFCLIFSPTCTQDVHFA